MPKQAEQTRQPVTHNLVRFVGRLTKYGAGAALAITIALSIAYALHVEGSGWDQVQSGRQRRSMYHLRLVADAIAEYERSVNDLPPVESASALHNALRDVLDRDLPSRDGWGQPIGCARRGMSILVWSTGLNGGDPGAMPDLLPEEKRVFPMRAFESDTVVLCGSGAEFQLSCRSERVCFVQYVVGSSAGPADPFGVGNLVAWVVWTFNGKSSD